MCSDLKAETTEYIWSELNPCRPLTETDDHQREVIGTIYKTLQNTSGAAWPFFECENGVLAVLKQGGQIHNSPKNYIQNKDYYNKGLNEITIVVYLNTYDK